MKHLYIGTSGFYYSNWKELFYPKDLPNSEMLEFYAKHMNTVEINSTFYAFPRQTTIQKWKDSVPDSFRFAFKVVQDISHSLDLVFDEKDVKRFIDSFEIFAGASPKNIFLFQLPASTHKNVKQLAKLVAILPSTFRYAFEFRHLSWFDDEIYDILRAKNAAIVIADTPQRARGGYVWPRKDVETSDFCYLRLHGSQKLYASPYSDEELGNFAGLMKGKLPHMESIFCFFNNTQSGAAIKNIEDIKKLLSSEPS